MTGMMGSIRGGIFRVDHGGSRRARALELRARRRAFPVFTLDLEGVASKAELLQRAAAALQFPDYFGANWDAFYDCLTDFSWRPAPGYVVRVLGAGAVRSRAAPALATALELLAEAAAYWQRQGVAFVVLVDTPDPAAFSRVMRPL
jgi:RNAse (barnase) inhibitor barstar